MKEGLKEKETPQIIWVIKQDAQKEESLMRYLEAYQAKSQMELIRKAMIVYAQKYGVKRAASCYECHRNTVSKWLNRFRKQKEAGLKDKSRAPHSIPHKIDEPTIIDKICSLRDEKGYGSERLKIQYDLFPSNMAIHRILRQNGKIFPRKKKYQKKKDLWALKKKLKTLEGKLYLDGKKLTDIANYYYYQQKFKLPTWQFSLRCPKSGATFISFMEGEKGEAACTFMTYVFEHLKRHQIDLTKLTIQMDGASFAHNSRSLKKTAFRELIESYGAKLKVMPGKSQEDVETFHNLIQTEFYERQSFSSREDFFLKAYHYIYHFNYIRKNRHKDWRTPLDFLKEDRPDISEKVLDLPPVYLEAHTDLYFAKLDPKYVAYEESMLLDTPPNELPVEDFSLDEFLDNFIKRVAKADPLKFPFYAHDVPIYPHKFTRWVKFFPKSFDRHIEGEKGEKNKKI